MIDPLAEQQNEVDIREAIQLLPQDAYLLFQLVGLAALSIERIGRAALIAAGVHGGSGCAEAAPPRLWHRSISSNQEWAWPLAQG